MEGVGVGGVFKVSEPKVQVVELPCLAQPHTKSYWIATSKRSGKER